MPPWWTCASSNRWMRRWCSPWPPPTISSSPWKTTPSWAGRSAVNELLMGNKQCKPVLNLGLPTVSVEQGTQEEIYAQLGLTATGIQASIEAGCGLTGRQPPDAF